MPSGRSGCGKSTLLRTLNRMNDLVRGVRIEGRGTYHGVDLYAPGVDPVAVRRHIGMVFPKPNPFPRSIYDNVAFGPRLHGVKRGLADIVERSLRDAAQWDEVKDILGRSGLAHSGGQQQRLCIARALATAPDVLLMDEPASALDPLATLRIEELMRSLRDRYTIVVVTHDLQQAARVSDWTAFLSVDLHGGGQGGELVEFDRTEPLCTTAADPRTEAHLTGRFG
jgi:phosphate transport system ATP-binding protein